MAIRAAYVAEMDMNKITSKFNVVGADKHEVNSAADTIFALSSGAGRSGVAVIRISGAKAGVIVAAMAGNLPTPRHAVYRALRSPVSGEVLDRGLVLWFPAPASFSGEDMAEFHVHGGLAVIEALLSAISTFSGVRPADAGEFTRRAFENGKLDLSEAEGIADLVNAETEAQRAQAVLQAGGALRARYERWRNDLISAMALVESGLDFADEADVPAEALALARPIVEGLAQELGEALADGRRGEILREGVHIAILGAPNAGKSSLLNALARRDAAIVSPEPGTTRDVIDVKLDLDGFPFILSDTAGLRETASEVEREGIRRAQARARDADLVLHLRDLTADGADALPAIPPEKVIKVWTKADLGPETGAGLRVSVVTGEGLDRLQEELVARARNIIGLGEPALITRARHRHDIEAAVAALRRFMGQPEKDAELLAEDLRLAATALGRLTGHVDVEDVLGKLFSDFCIGK